MLGSGSASGPLWPGGLSRPQTNQKKAVAFVTVLCICVSLVVCYGFDNSAFIISSRRRVLDMLYLNDLPFNSLLNNHFNMLHIDSWYFFVKHCGPSWDLTTGFCKYGLALAFPKVPKQPRCPLTFEPPFAGKQRWSSNLHLLWCFTPTLLLRKRERLPHEFTSSGVSEEKKMNWLRILGGLTQAVIVSPQSFCSLFVAPHLFPFSSTQSFQLQF